MKKILIIEDEKLILDNTIEMLEFEHFELFGAESGADGVRLAQAHLPDLILCDVRMPGMDGYAVLEQLRQNPKTAAIPFIFMSAMADAQEAHPVVADAWLLKPFLLDDLLRVIQQHLNS